MADIERLVADRVEEGYRLEYKQGWGRGRSAERLRDLTALANCRGGYLIAGVREQDHVPVEVVGVDGDPDEITQALEKQLRDNVDPRITGHRIQVVAGPGDKFVLVVEVPRSRTRPHMVSLDKDNGFYMRNSRGKHQMDALELRRAFADADQGERLRGIRRDRIKSVVSGATPYGLSGACALVCHAFPLDDETTSDASLDEGLQRPLGAMLAPANAFAFGYGIDGYTTCAVRAVGLCHAYATALRHGGAEYVRCLRPENGELYIRVLEANLEAFWGGLVALRKHQGFDLPMALFVTLVGCTGLRLGPSVGDNGPRNEIFEDPLYLPDVVVTEFDSSWKDALGALRALIWNAAGYATAPR